MAALIWVAVGIALWHFTIFVPDRFWQGIVGAFLGSVIGGVISGALFQVILGRGIGEADFLTLLTPIPGFLLGAWVVYRIGTRQEEDLEAGVEAAEEA